MTRFDNANYTINITNLNQESVTMNFEIQVNNSRQQSHNNNSLIMWFIVHLQFHRPC